ncbi:MAG TPA: hypothetical protein VFO29_09950 [Candidatus Rubrimentiphilum sp.]|nr:hypothetical protein [Candidatus Rubrimentiphilum sp.]
MNLQHLFAALAFALSPAAFAQTIPSSPAPVPSPSATQSSPGPSPTASPLPTPLVLPPDAAPQILAVTVNEPEFHSGDVISSTVITSTNVAAVELRILGRAIRYPRTDFGIWQLNYTVPHIPRHFLRDYNAQIVAMNTAGATTAFNVVISLR